MIKESINIAIGGEAGDGILSAGEILCKIFFEAGTGLCTYKNFPSRIRGGHTSYSIRIADALCAARARETDILVAFDEESFDFHNGELKDSSIVIYDPARVKSVKKPQHCSPSYFEIPFGALSTEKFSKPLYKNAVMIGAVAAILNLDAACVEKGFAAAVGPKKGDGVLKINIDAYRLGVEVYNNTAGAKKMKMPPGGAAGKDSILISGNEAATIGAIAAGCRFAAAYPISPATEIFEMMCSELPKAGGTAMQAEDEIAALCAAIGAGFAGARSMTSTSGPGLSLMAEAIGLAGCAEVPVVIIDAQRPGPSTGLPTKTEQGDLHHALFCSHGDTPRIVIAAATVGECFEFAANAFNLAEIYQCPVILLTEQAIAQNKFVADKFDFSKITVDRGRLLTDAELNAPGRKFLRYEFTPDGISPRAIPSQAGGVHLCNGNEHMESGRISEDPAVRKKITEKRMKKIKAAASSKYLPAPKYFGAPDGRFGVITMGSATAAASEAFDILAAAKAGRRDFAGMQLTSLMPFPAAAVADFISKREKVLVVENNYSAQLCGVIKMHVPAHDKLVSALKYDGTSYSAGELADIFTEVK